MAKRTRKPKAVLTATSRGVVYLQPVKRGGKLGKAIPFVATTVQAGAPRASVKRKKRR